jgi:thiamine pyrophosphate-dependent acetolactate synthase large subunit-like protein
VARVSGGVLAARAIQAHGIDTIFALGAAAATAGVEGVGFVDVLHGQTAAHAAEAWGRINRKCGVAVVTSAQAVASTFTAIAGSAAAQTPLLVAGSAIEGLDARAISGPIVKWNGVCDRPERIGELVATAFRHALAQPRGPVYLELPMDLLRAETDDVDVAPSRTNARIFGDPREVMKAAELLNAAERPVVVAGSGIWWDGAWKQLAFFAQNGLLPTFLHGSARGALPPDHDLLFRHSQRAALDAADVVCVIGTTLDSRGFGAAKLVQIHADATEIGRHRAPGAGIVGDCAAVLGVLADGVKNVRVDREPWLERLRESERAWWDEHRALIESNATPANPYRLGKALGDVLDPGTIVIADGGDVVTALSQVLPVHRPGHWLDSEPFGCLGVGPAYALGVKSAKPDKQVVVITDDVAFGSDASGYEALVRLRQPAVFVVAVTDDRATRRPDELGPALERALASGEPAIVNVRVG